MGQFKTYSRILISLVCIILAVDTSLAQTGDWYQIGADIDGLAAGDNFGNSVSMSADGSVVAVGAYSASPGGVTDKGQVLIYKNQSGSWAQIGLINGEAEGDWFGKSVSLSDDGTIVAIGAFWSDGNGGVGSQAGSVQIFAFNSVNSIWEKIGNDINGEFANDETGWSVSLNSDNGTIVAIGDHLYDDGVITNAGRVRVFENNAGTWTQIGEDITGIAAGDQCGQSVSINNNGTIVAIGSNLNDDSGINAGHVRVFENIAGTWTQIGSAIVGENASDESGHSVSLNSDGTIVAVGAYLNDGNGNNSGQVRVFENISDVWTQIGADIDGEAIGDRTARYGVSLNSDGTKVAIGAEYHDGAAGADQGEVRIFENQSGSWVQVGSNIYGEAADDRFGVSVAISSDGSVVAAGGYFNDVEGTLPNAGHVQAFAYKTDATWTGGVDDNWEETGNWDTGVVPDATYNVIIPADLTNYPTLSAAAECYNLTIESSATSTGSIVGQSNLTVNGTATVQRYVDGTQQWHLISSPIPGQTIASFLEANAGISSSGSAPVYRAMADYQEATNVWNAFFTEGQAGDMEAGKGFEIRTESAGTIEFTGSLEGGAVQAAVTSSGTGWNCIGVPFPSAVFINEAAKATANFIAFNSADLDDSYQAVYVWNPGTSSYDIITLGGDAYTAGLGQAFMVKVKTGLGIVNLNFTTAMQTNAPSAEFKNAVISNPEIKLIAEQTGRKSSTNVIFKEGMSNGLDIGNDVGMFKSVFNLYSKLVEDNGVDFGIQSLPVTNIVNSEVALGIDTKASGEVMFSAETSNFPDGTEIILEDRLNGIFANLNDGEVYSAQVERDEPGTGRFYIHTKSSTTGIKDDLNAEFNVYPSSNKIVISGLVNGVAKAYLFDIMGRQMKAVELEQSPVNYISTSDIKSGIYLLQIQHEGGIFTKKVQVNR